MPVTVHMREKEVDVEIEKKFMTVKEIKNLTAANKEVTKDNLLKILTSNFELQMTEQIQCFRAQFIVNLLLKELWTRKIGTLGSAQVVI